MRRPAQATRGKPWRSTERSTSSSRRPTADRCGPLTAYDRRVRDDDIRSSCFARLHVLCAHHGEDIPYRDGLDAGFPFRGRRVPFLSAQKGIYRAATQRGPAALSIQTSSKSPYDDEPVDAGFLYAYRSGSIDQPDNRALRAAYDL